MLKLTLILLTAYSFIGCVEAKDYVHSCEYKELQTEVGSLACNLYFESRGESLAGVYAVGFVTLNRKDSSRFPDTIKGVVYQRSQFSWTKDGRSDRVYDLKSWVQCLQIASILIDNTYEYGLRDITNGALFYHTGKVSPNWASDHNVTVTIDNHIFYRDDVKL